jgi:flagellar hook assembly protein FlgD
LPPSPTITPTYSITNTPMPTATQDVPVVTSHNVFNPEKGVPVSIWLKAPTDGTVQVKVFDIAGNLVRPVFDSSVSAGIAFQAAWDGKNDQGEIVASGVYFVSVRGAGIRTIRKVVVLK